MENKKELIRVNTRISNTSNKWIDDYSSATGLPKSTIIMMAIENFIKEHTAVDSLGHMAREIQELRALVENNK